MNQPTLTGDTPLHIAAARPSLTILSLLIKYKANTVARNGEGELSTI